MGFIFAFSAAFLIAAKDIVSKSVSTKVSGTISTIASFLYALPFYLILLAIFWFFGLEHFNVTGAFFGFVVLRAISDIGAEWCKMTALSKGDLSIVTAFYSISPVFLLVLSPLITGDKITTSGAIGVLLVGAGTLIFGVKTKGGERPPYKAIAFALCSAIFFSINACFDKLAIGESTPLLSGFAMTALSGFILLPFSKEPLRPALAIAHRPFLIRGLIETVFMTCKLAALQYLSAPYVVATMRASIILSIISGRTIFNEGDFRKRLIGGTLIMIGIIIISFSQLN